MTYIPSRPVLIAGVKHSGKSTVGAILAGRLNLPFFDLDDLVVSLCREDRGGNSAITWEPREIYRRLGKAGFQNLELRALRLQAEFPSLYVLALGGGTPEAPESRKFLSGMGIMVYLHEEADILFERIVARGLPPFLDTRTPRESFRELYTRRDALYRETAEITVELKGATAQEGTDHVISKLQEYENVR